MNARFIFATALAGMCALIPVHANAAQFHVIYDGKITGGVDADDIFGLAGKTLIGRGLRADITYSTSIGGIRMTNTTSDELYGGYNFSTVPVMLSAIFTLGSSSFNFSPSYYNDLYTSAGYLDAYGYDLLGNSFQTYITPDNVGPYNLETPFYSTGKGDPGGPLTQLSYLITGNDDIDFNATSVTVAAVPEPATWAMMLVGFGAMGYTMRRRKKIKTVSLVA